MKVQLLKTGGERDEEKEQEKMTKQPTLICSRNIHPGIYSNKTEHSLPQNSNNI